jgi:hypothetical protein
LESNREVSKERIKRLSNTLKCPYIECSALQSGPEIEKIFYKLLKEIEKENSDLYPYDIKNSSVEMNFIRKNHKTFNYIMLVLILIQIVKTI